MKTLNIIFGLVLGLYACHHHEDGKVDKKQSWIYELNPSYNKKGVLKTKNYFVKSV